MKNLKQALAQRQAQGLYRKRRILHSPQGREIIIDAKPLINFCSNDYLGLANHPQVKKAFIAGCQQYGTGSGSAHLVNGHSKAHHALEEELAAFCEQPRALLFSTGYMANLSVAQSLFAHSKSQPTYNSCIIEDKLNHASLLDAASISDSKLIRFLHRDYNSLQKKLQRCTTENNRGECTDEILVSTDTVFSMDGDEADIPAIMTHCQAHNAWLMLDDAHGFGVLGENGRGSLNHQQVIADSNTIYMATLGKALGTAGAFIAGSEDLIEYLIQTARCYIYTTAMPPAIAEATRTSLRLLTEENWRQQALHKNIHYFKTLAAQTQIKLLESSSAIQPVITGDTKKTVEISQQLFSQGLHIAAIRPPTVAENTARLRITLRADHTMQDIERLVSLLDACILEAGLTS
ncbi:8-amino-7-oxononanoate synthase [hydrothermal vent metagenome]|uniref:8-amino-7-oxononanoate synthase n=2 Tax=hydrothermal vent metagenome TaxID=652676 RepID=A0A3B0Y5L8_9ZZZZ